MIIINRRAAGILALTALSLALASCGDSEPDQRKAFVTFLQSRIVDKPGLHVPTLTGDEKSSFGPYADHYAVIADFNRDMNKILTGPYKISQTNAPGSLQELVARRAEVKAMGDSLAHASADAQKLLAEANAKQAALKQPDDLQAVYAKAYGRTVSLPAEAFLATIPLAVDSLNKSVQLADYLDAHQATVKISGAHIQTADNKANAEIRELLNAISARNRLLADARQHLSAITTGR